MSEDQELNDMLSSFMRRLRRYLDEGGPDDVIDRILAAGSVAAAAVMILWTPHRKASGLVGALLAIGRQLWARRQWYGIPDPPQFHDPE